MSTEDQEQRTGGIPHAFGNRLVWHWVDEMPAYLKQGFLTMLFSLRQHAAPSGEVRFNGGNHRPIKLSRLSRSAGCREQDGRRYIEAAIRAGLVTVVGERKRGATPLFQLLVNAHPDWKAAEDYLRATSRGAGRKFPKVAKETRTSDHGGTNSSEPQTPEGTEEVRTTVARPTSDHGGTTTSDHRGPNKPCVFHAGYHDGAEVVRQPQVVGGSASDTNESPISEETEQPTGGVQQEPSQEPDQEQPGEAFDRCEVCRIPLMRAGNRCSRHREDVIPGHRPRRAPAGRGRAIQSPLLAPVPDAPAEPPVPAQAPSRPAAELPDPFAPERLCPCGELYRSRKPGGRCPECTRLAAEEAARLAARGVSGA